MKEYSINQYHSYQRTIRCSSLLDPNVPNSDVWLWVSRLSYEKWVQWQRGEIKVQHVFGPIRKVIKHTL